MGESQWWLYDLVVLAIAILCVWNGVRGGAIRAGGSLIIGIISCIAAAILSSSVSEIAYDTFFQSTCQRVIESKLEETDITGSIRGELEQNGIYLPYDDEQIAEIIEDVRRDDSAMEQAAALLGVNPDELDEKLGQAVDYAVETESGIIPEWAANALTSGSTEISIDSAADTAVAILKDDYHNASAGIEKNYVRPVVTSFLKMIAFVLIASLLSMLLRTALLVLPNRKGSLAGTLIGAALGLAKAGIYLYLIVLLVGSISSMQNGEYPFYSRGTINQTYLFRIFYDMWQ